ncbi:1,2-phenylacetyl-CoA epoxidase subunit PaaC [Actinacidiphila bryophytorum]|uniref:Ring-1,2-phenylacetyl-CoA epoxidase subunit PaaC n=1 Tax=Actinacidiphila bryophytorum TaxID=1436133 RepID=A0A9W4H395_9ACTN|nr:1,2-phenylacetyl-CoA epoxidase subunit PaaC [Actinacidiphila bryophytorum]MBM9438069.1 phenylacetate-CoA oxygenase subunit PaaC [Actinacidiphila bryophytorum]MBN6544998.1 phenylacetate-CoA oxygenase subunit PaaC [Actinacidiphila bryophytorum]CAG7647218.1 Ring-1,2-phenylacetyl-CoA epoxidase subunit PaaC [Actinacidiphila bryophytorum]
MSDDTDDHVYLSLAEGHDDGDSRWAFGTGFEDPLHGVDTSVPDGVDPAEVAAVCLALGDDALVSAQRLAQWCTRAPELEEEVALANIGLDLLGQARLLYARCGQVDGSGRGEDAYAYTRDAADFRNVRLAELPDTDFAFCVVRLLVLSSWRLALFGRLALAADPVLAAVAAKGVAELAYHRQYAADWALRLGDGTEESHRRMRAALAEVAPYLDEVLEAEPPFAVRADQAGPSGDARHTGDADAVRRETLDVLGQVLSAAGLDLPAVPALPGSGRRGEHTGHLAPLLAELQSVARAHPEATW